MSLPRVHLPVLRDVEPDGDGAYLVDGERVTMPERYSECEQRYANGVCPWARCVFNLMVDVDEDDGTLGLNYGRVMSELGRREARVVSERPPDLEVGDDPGDQLDELVDWWAWLNEPHVDDDGNEVEDRQPTCAIWWADNGGALDRKGLTLEEVGDLLNVTRERVRQIETRAMSRLRDECKAQGVKVFVDPETRHAMDEISDYAEK